jgi:hypothetical protein
MKESSHWYIRVLPLALVVAGCSGTDESSGSKPAELGDPTDTGAATLMSLGPFRHRTFGTGGAQPGGASATGGTPSAQATGGSSPVASGTGGATSYDCSICTRANDCCNAVGAGALCTFSAATCFAESPPVAQASYTNYCVTLLRTTITAWTSAGQTPPAVCSL